AGQHDRLADGNFSLNAAGPRLFHSVVVKVGIAARLAGVEVKQAGSHALEGLELEPCADGAAERLEILAVCAPTENGLIGVEVAVDSEPEMCGCIVRALDDVADCASFTTRTSPISAAAHPVGHLKRQAISRFDKTDPGGGAAQ